MFYHDTKQQIHRNTRAALDLSSSKFVLTWIHGYPFLEVFDVQLMSRIKVEA